MGRRRMKRIGEKTKKITREKEEKEVRDCKDQTKGI
jgi:hypothetical protein